MSLDKQLRSICQDRCAEAGDPPCHRLDLGGLPWTPCSPCLVDAGEPEPPAPLDPNAVIRNLI